MNINLCAVHARTYDGDRCPEPHDHNTRSPKYPNTAGIAELIAQDPRYALPGLPTALHEWVTA